jgi:hypothetical protein
MENFNLTRGRERFEALMSDLTTSENETGMKLFTALLSPNVGVMEVGKLEFDEDNLSLKLNGFAPSFKKLAYSVLYTLQNKQNVSLSDIFKTYQSGAYNALMPKESSSTSVDNEKLSLEIQENSDSMANYETVTTEDGQDFLIDMLNLIEDMTEEELSDEGLRANGIFKWNEEVSSSTSYAINNPKSLKRGKIIACEDNSWQIECPHTGSRNVYRISTSVYASVETDQPFYVNISLPDLEI